MKYLYSWLQEFYPQIPSLDELASLFIQLGHDVEAINRLDYTGIIVGEITAINPHPNADRLKITTVFDGEIYHEVVCGAPNITVGMKAPYVKPGIELPTGTVIRAAKVRGVASDGMLCAEDELGLGPSHDGLYALRDDAKPGLPVKDFLPEDAIIVLDITPNRGDVLSHFGLARDIKAAVEQSLLIPEMRTVHYSGKTSDMVGFAEVNSDTLAIRFALAEAEAHYPPPSLTMQARLCNLGYKSINLATDITNYVMLAYGQPLHAYDASRVPDLSTLGVRRAHSESFQGLHNLTKDLGAEALVITSADTPISLAGVLGGESTKVTEKTTTVLFESATFNEKSIRVASRKNGIITESSLRFERGVDPSLRTYALDYALWLWTTISHGQARQPTEWTQPQSKEQVSALLEQTRINTFFGQSIPMEQVVLILRGLGCHITSSGEGKITVTPPSWRYDLVLAEDYYEEIMRLMGLQHVAKKSLPATVPMWKRSRYWRNEYLKDILVALGAYEIKTYPFIGEDDSTALGRKGTLIALTSAPLQNKNYLRDTLQAGMLEAIHANPETPFLALFEVATVFLPHGETEHLALSVSSNNQSEVDAWWQNFFERQRLPVSSWMSRVKVVSEATVKHYKIRKAIVTYLELPVEELSASKTYEIPPVVIPDIDSIEFIPLSKFQTSRRDIAFIVSTSFDADTIADELADLHPYIIDIELFDTFRGPTIGNDNQSLAFHILYQAPDRTLTTDEINELHKMVESFIKERYHGNIR